MKLEHSFYYLSLSKDGIFIQINYTSKNQLIYLISVPVVLSHEMSPEIIF
jgi:hypothetical protein